jgi:hypothetical protein
MTTARRDRALAAVVVVIGVVVLAFSWSPLTRLMPTDSPGYYVIGDVPDCRAKTYCRSRTGTFTSDDRKVINKSTRMNNQLPTSVKKGDSVRAFDIGAEAVYLLTKPRSFNGDEWLFTGTFLGLVAIASGSYWLWRSRERLHAKGPGAIEVPEHEPPAGNSRNRPQDRGRRARRRRRRKRARTDPTQ